MCALKDSTANVISVISVEELLEQDKRKQKLSQQLITAL